MNKLTSDPRLPTVNDEKIRPLTQRLYELFRQFTNAVNALIDFEQSDWVQFTPTITSGSGSFTSVSGVGNYLKRGKIIYFTVNVSCTTIGTAGTSVLVSLPYSEYMGILWAGSGGNTSTGKMVKYVITENGSNAVVKYYDNSFPIGSGESLTITGFYGGY